MLSKRREIQSQIVLVAVHTRVLRRSATYFADGNAAAQQTGFYDDVSDLETFPWDVINARYWNDFPDGKRIKCAEVLVHRCVPVEDIVKLICLPGQQDEVRRFMPHGISIPVEPDSDFYFKF